MVNLVTGFRNEPHITPEDDRSFNASIFGTGKYVLNRGSLFEYEIISNNLIKIKDGDAINQGAHIRIEKNNYEEVTIDNGSQSLNRIDLIVLRYEKNLETKIETVSLVVIKGTEAESPVMPEHETGNMFDGDYIDDMPLYAVKLEGINITSVEPLFNLQKVINEDINEIKIKIDEQSEKIDKNIRNPSSIKNGYFIDTILSEGNHKVPDYWRCDDSASFNYSSGYLYFHANNKPLTGRTLSATLYQKLTDVYGKHVLSMDAEIVNDCEIEIITSKYNTLGDTYIEETLNFIPETGKNVFYFEGKPIEIKINVYSTQTSFGAVGMKWIKLELGEKETPVYPDIGLDPKLQQNILWSGARYMDETQTATLNDKVSEQSNGIIIVFSTYQSGEAKDFDWHCFFIPKKMIELHSGTGHTFSMNSVGYGRIAGKYLYIYNDKITGNADNKMSGTANGVTINNALYVMRYVIGV